ncbi:mfs multidrug transporter [Diplodia corticola]|uniref:Mfs multidrug transporter n=1 Tax=Diplodia corticola TaxID=236234 RepID=A0A1J9RWD3_9PEZI|nr:mfs multidrug transporter [Diplodia corticola]OJD31789.1 mfs multidrug transporter [Diplodia corticola]
MSAQTGLVVPSLFSDSRTSSTTDVSDVKEKQQPDVECQSIDNTGSASESEEKEDSNLVTWDGPNDPENPKNWTQSRKWATTMIVSAFAFVSPLSSSMAAPALDAIGTELHIPDGFQLQMVLSIFLLAYSFGSFVLSPCSEIWGRSWIIRTGNAVFILFNTACGFSQSRAQITAFRFISGFGGSAMLGMGAGVLSDCWLPSERGKGFSIYQLAPVLGPALGPIAGGFISQYTTWRWTFWSITLFNLFIQTLGLFFLRETYAPRILLLKARALRAKTGNASLRTQWERDDRTLPKLLAISLTRPWRLLATQPIVQLLALYQAYNYGMLYLLISSFPSLWEGKYGMPKGVASLNYISLAVGSLIGAQICGPMMDAIYRRLQKRSGTPDKPGPPEFRIPMMVPASIISPCGVFLYAWSAQAQCFWLVPNIGAALFACGSMISYQCISTYIVDCYAQYSASASAASGFLRSLAAFGFPLFVPYLFKSLGYGVGGSILGAVSVVLGIPAPLLFWKYGSVIRAWSSFDG